MNLNRIVLILFLLFWFNATFGQPDSSRTLVRSSAEDSINAAMQMSVDLIPPVFHVSLYIDGRKKRNLNGTFLMVNQVKQYCQHGSWVAVSQDLLKMEDSIPVYLIFKADTLVCRNVEFRKYIHGGGLVFGIINDYPKQKKRFDLDQAAYLDKNRSNYLYNLLTIIAGKNIEMQSRRLFYTVFKSNVSPRVSFEYIFK